MLQNSTGSINKFLQNNSFSNNYTYTIKYTNRSKHKEPYFNKSFFNRKRRIIPPDIELIQENRLLTSDNRILDNNYTNNDT